MAEAQTAPGREYETIYVLRPDVTKERAERVSTRVAEVMDREGGTLTLVENWGRRALAFAVSNHRRAHYVYLKYLGGGKLVTELERNFRMLDDVLKYQTVKLRDNVDLATLQVVPEDVEFEAIEPPEDDEPEQTLAEQLGLTEPPARVSREREQAASEEGSDSSATSESKNDAAGTAEAGGEGEE